MRAWVVRRHLDHMKPRVFIGSSSEGLAVARAIAAGIRQVAEPQTWDKGVFELSQSTFAALVAAVDDSDFAILVLTPDDDTKSRGARARAPRDNVVFELGLFLGRLGPRRTFFVRRHDAALKLPSDLLGITAGTFELRRGSGLVAAVRPFCATVRDRVAVEGPRPRLLERALRTAASTGPSIDLSGIWKGYAPEGPKPRQAVSTLTIEQCGALVRARVVRSRRKRQFVYEGWLVGNQLLLYFEDVAGPGLIVGTMILSPAGDLRSLHGRTTFYHHTKKAVVSESREYRRVRQRGKS